MHTLSNLVYTGIQTKNEMFRNREIDDPLIKRSLLRYLCVLHIILGGDHEDFYIWGDCFAGDTDSGLRNDGQRHLLARVGRRDKHLSTTCALSGAKIPDANFAQYADRGHARSV